mmetsp:Transcript_35172/g.75099  ORF Transcript_35172/g.75099 Transcript_35172/m.75099 type:complete len:213 (-) Transcript_35172:181-819(-)
MGLGSAGDPPFSRLPDRQRVGGGMPGEAEARHGTLADGRRVGGGSRLPAPRRHRARRDHEGAGRRHRRRSWRALGAAHHGSQRRRHHRRRRCLRRRLPLWLGAEARRATRSHPRLRVRRGGRRTDGRQHAALQGDAQRVHARGDADLQLRLYQRLPAATLSLMALQAPAVSDPRHGAAVAAAQPLVRGASMYTCSSADSRLLSCCTDTRTRF